MYYGMGLVDEGPPDLDVGPPELSNDYVIPDTGTPTFSVTSWAPMATSIPWWVWALGGLVLYQSMQKKGRR